MKLNDRVYTDRSLWESRGYYVGSYDRNVMQEKTKENPCWVHFGAGNIFRAFHANLAERLLEEKSFDRGLIVVEGFDYEIVEKMYRPHDDLSLLVTLKADGSVEKRIIGSIAASAILDSNNKTEYDGLKEIFRKPSLQVATFTITEKGYAVKDAKGAVLPAAQADFEAGPERPQSYLGKVTSLLYERYLAGELPIAMVSTDNCSHNGDLLRAAILAYASAWIENGKAKKGFYDYLTDPSKVSFPWSMIDKITPRPDASVRKMLEDDGVEDTENVITSKKTYVAPFVNSEESEYLVIEDAFPNGRPPLEKAGVIFTQRETVDLVERMKVCTCLNPLHTALAVYGCLLGYTKISEEMKDSQLLAMVKKIGYDEGFPVVVDPGVISPKEFLDTVVNRRIPNPFMPDTPQRIATDTSQKLSVRYGQTIKNYKKQGLSTEKLTMIPLVFAGWLRYLAAVDDQGNAFELSPDLAAEHLAKTMQGFHLGKTDRLQLERAVGPVLENESIFGVNLREAGLYDNVLDDLTALFAGKGAVRQTLTRMTQTE